MNKSQRTLKARLARASKAELALSLKIGRALHVPRVNAGLLCRLFARQIAAYRQIATAQSALLRGRKAQALRKFKSWFYEEFSRPLPAIKNAS